VKSRLDRVEALLIEDEAKKRKEQKRTEKKRKAGLDRRHY
jgi:hypothetical protein